MTLLRGTKRDKRACARRKHQAGLPQLTEDALKRHARIPNTQYLAHSCKASLVFPYRRYAPSRVPCEVLINPYPVIAPVGAGPVASYSPC